MLSDALSQAVRLARVAKMPLVADLGFSTKKKELGEASPKAARMPSGSYL